MSDSSDCRQSACVPVR